MKSDEREKGTPARQSGARRARSPKPKSMRGISPSRASSLSIQPQDVSLTRMLETLKPHDHLCLIYESQEEWRATAVPFIAMGLKRGEKCTYIVDTSTADEIRKYLGEEGVDVASAEKSGQLSVLHETEAYTREGSFDPDRMIALLISEAEKDIAEGYPALRLTGEMTWVLHGLPGSERLLEYEAKLNRDFFPKYPCLAICQYDRWKFDPDIIKGVIMTHPLLVRGDRIYHNFYYVPPEEFFNRKRAELEVQHWLNNVEREQRIMDTLRESEERHRTLFERTANPILVIDTEGNYIDANEAALQFLECTREELLTKNTRDYLPPSKQRQMIREHLPLWKSGGRIETEHFVNGKLKTLDLTITPGVWHDKRVVFGVGADITERKQMDVALRQSEERYRTIIEDMDEGYFELDLAGNFTVVNDAHCRNVGYTRQELVGMHYIRVVHEEDPEAVRKGLKRMFKTGQPSLGLHRKVLRKDGSIRFAEISVFPLRSEDGKTTGFRGIGWDITDHKRAEESLRLSEQNFRDSIENSPLGIRILDKDGKTLYANRSLLDILGYSSVEELEAVLRKQRYTPASYDEHRERVEKRKRGEYVPLSYEISIVRSDGQVRYLLASRGELLWNGEKQFQVVYQDITERKQAEEKYQTIVRTTIDGFWFVDMQGHFLDVNEAYCHLTGYSRDELLNMAITDVEAIEKPEETAKRIRKIKEVGYDRFETRHRCKDGEIIDIGISVNYLPIDGGRMVVFIRDITERKRIEEALVAKQAQLLSIFDSIEAVAYVTDPETYEVLYVNKFTKNLLGTDPTGGRCYKEFQDLDHPCGFCTNDIILKEKGKTYQWEHHNPKVDRDYILFDRIIKWPGERDVRFEFGIDITERKRVEEALRRSEERYRTILSEMQDNYFEVDLAGNLTFFNDSTSNSLGYSAEELMGMSYREFTASEDIELVYKAFNKVYRTNRSNKGFLWKVVRKDGTVRFVEATFSPLRNPKGEIIGFRGVGRDITERKRVEEKYQTIVRTTIDGFWLVDMQGHFLDVNEAYCHLTGYSRDELLNMAITDVEAIEKPEETAKRIRKIKEVGYDRFETRHRRKDGEIIDVGISVNYLPIDGGRMFVFIRDITERKRMEEELRASHDYLDRVINSMVEALVVIDADSNIMDVNSCFLKYYGRKREDIIGRKCYEITHQLSKPCSTAQHPCPLRTVLKTGKSFNVEHIHKAVGGHEIIVEISSFPLVGPAGNVEGVVQIQQDVTERKRAEEERKQLEQKAQVTSRLASVGEMAAGVAHEINNPLTGVIGYAQLLMDGKDIPSDIRRDLAAINEGAQRVASIVKRLLVFSRQVKPERRDVDINELIESTLALRAYHLRVNNIKVTIQLAPDLPETMADPGQLQQVFLNLVVNAETEMKLAHGKGKLLIKTEKVDNTIRISFKDNGPGIAKKNLERIFDPFFTTREVGQGTGLGLSLCYGIVAEHNGKIYAESKLGKGATFIIELPVVTEVAPPKPAEPDVKKPEKVAKARILVVDDEQVIRDLVKRVLAGEGYEVDTVDNAGDALKKIKGKRYNLVLLDIKMPGMDGIELHKRIQKIAKSLTRRVVFITGDIMGADTEKFLSEIKAAHIDKPFNAEQLRREVRRALTGGQ